MLEARTLEVRNIKGAQVNPILFVFQMSDLLPEDALKVGLPSVLFQTYVLQKPKTKHRNNLQS